MPEENYDDLDLTDEEMEALKEDDDIQEQENPEIDTDEIAPGDQGNIDLGDAGDKDGKEDPDEDEVGAGGSDNTGVDNDVDLNASVEADENKVKSDSHIEADPGKEVKPVTNQSPESIINYDEKIKALDQKLEDGELDFEEYKKGLRAIENELRSVEREHVKATVRDEIARADAEKTWQSEQQVFFGENGYLKENAVVFDAYAREVNRIIADPKSANRSGADILAEAKNIIDGAFGLKRGDNKPQKKEVSEGHRAIRDAKKESANRTPPKTLRDIPAADDNSDGKFDSLDNLEGEELEAAVANMSSAQRREWARA